MDEAQRAMELIESEGAGEAAAAGGSRRQPAPAHLSEEARDWWDYIVAAFEIDASREILLRSALESFDAVKDAREKMADPSFSQHGRLVKDRFGQYKPHPLVAVETKYRAQMHDAFHKLNLDVEPLQSGPGRPPKPSSGRQPGLYE